MSGSPSSSRVLNTLSRFDKTIGYTPKFKDNFIKFLIGGNKEYNNKFEEIFFSAWVFNRYVNPKINKWSWVVLVNLIVVIKLENF